MQKTLLASIFASTTICLPQPAFSEALRGNDLLAMCQMPVTDPDGAYCAGFIAGVGNGMDLGALIVLGAFNALDGTDYSPTEAAQAFTNTCTDENVSLGQKVLVIVKWLEDNPAQLHEPAVWLVKQALSDAFPCE
ncbi:Rap1a/Tai family immunity protein [Oceaniradius stylonematis]|uniref:Rap1a/Tai family immunity protein n=1 Tax=Oceaniradius stylonematis TaxID=2184161 RepID=UPI003C7B565B